MQTNVSYGGRAKACMSARSVESGARRVKHPYILKPRQSSVPVMKRSGQDPGGCRWMISASISSAGYTLKPFCGVYRSTVCTRLELHCLGVVIAALSAEFRIEDTVSDSEAET